MPEGFCRRSERQQTQPQTRVAGRHRKRHADQNKKTYISKTATPPYKKRGRGTYAQQRKLGMLAEKACTIRGPYVPLSAVALVPRTRSVYEVSCSCCVVGASRRNGRRCLPSCAAKEERFENVNAARKAIDVCQHALLKHVQKENGRWSQIHTRRR